MKKISALLLVLVMIFASAFSVSAAENPVLGYDSSYNAEKGVVTVSVYIDNAEGLQAVDLNLGFDEAMYSFKDYETMDIEDGMIIAAYIERTPGLATCSVIFTEECVQSDLDENGKLQLVTFVFEPVAENYDLNEFYLWASSLVVGEKDIFEDISGVGNDTLQEDKTDVVTCPPDDNADNTTKKTTQSVGGKLGSKWYVYVIAGALAVGAIAGIVMVSVKSSHDDEEDEASGVEAEASENDKE